MRVLGGDVGIKLEQNRDDPLMSSAARMHEHQWIRVLAHVIGALKRFALANRASGQCTYEGSGS